MGKEIERKFLVKDRSYQEQATGRRHILQCYLSREPGATVRLRIADGAGWLTVKSANRGAERGEWEFQIPEADVRAMMEQCTVSAVIDKTRWLVPAGNGLMWEVDEFHGLPTPLTVAELELPSVETPLPPLPAFVGEEVTGKPEYYNSNIAAQA